MDGVRRVQIQRLTAAVAPARAPAATAALAVAYSGGPDSTALLHALSHAGHDVPVRAIHVCHYLQADARQWVAHCRDVCARLGVPLTCLDVTVEQRGEGMEAAARRARYAALQDALQPGETLVLAHHADDQAETFLLQALRGAGVAGLAAMPPQRGFARGMLWRPLLAVPRATLQAYVEVHGLPTVDDPSNHDTALDRGYMRETLWPDLTRRWPAAGRTLARAAHWCGQTHALVAEVAAEDAARVTDACRRIHIDALRQLSAFRQANVLRHWLAEGGFDTPDHRHVEQMQWLLTARAHGGPLVAWRHTQVRAFDGCLYAMAPLQPVPHNWRAHWRLEAPLALPHGCGKLTAQFRGTPADALDVRLRQGGERYADMRRGGTRTLKALLQEKRVPPWLRPRLPLLYHAGDLLAVADLWQAPALAQRLGVDALQLRWHRPD